MKKLIFFIFVIILLLISFIFNFSNKKNEVITIKFSTWGSQSEIIVLKRLLKQFEEENKDIKVELLHAPANYFPKLHLYFASKTEPDVVFINNIYFPKYNDAALFENLTPYFKEEIKNDVFFNSTLNGFRKDDNIYVIPRDASNIVIYYNKDIFRKYNVAFPIENWTLDDLRKKAKLLTKDTNNDKITDIWGINRNDKMIFWLPFMTVNNAYVIDEYGKLGVLSNDFIKSMQNYCDYVNVFGISPKESELSGKTHAQLFMNGKLAMYVGGRWNIPKFKDIKDFEWDVINFPSQKNSFIPADASGWAISKNSKHKEKSIKLVKFLSSSSSINEFTKTGFISAARKDIALSQTFLNLPKNKNNQAFIYAINHSKSQYLNKNIKETEDILSALLEGAFNGSKTVEECINNSKYVKKLCSLNKCN